MFEDLKNLATASYTIEFGPHTNCAGFFAQVYKSEEIEECDECGAPMNQLYDDAYHAETLEDALSLAIEALK